MPVYKLNTSNSRTVLYLSHLITAPYMPCISLLSRQVRHTVFTCPLILPTGDKDYAYVRQQLLGCEWAFECWWHRARSFAEWWATLQPALASVREAGWRVVALPQKPI